MVLLAALAMSCGEYIEVTADPPAIHNVTERDITVTVQQYRGGLACGGVPDGSLWKAPETLFLHYGDYAPLPVPIGNEGNPISGAADAGASDAGSAEPVGDPRCGTAIISTAGLDAVGVRWDVRGIAHIDSVEGQDRVVPGAIYLEQFGNRVRVAWGQGMRRFDVE
jgi:hypothetical protein